MSEQLKDLLAQYVDLANAHGRDSQQAREFLAKHADNVELQTLCRASDSLAEDLANGILDYEAAMSECATKIG